MKPDDSFEQAFQEFAQKNFAKEDGTVPDIVFFCLDKEVPRQSLVKDCKSLVPRVVLLGALLPTESACVRCASLFSSEPIFFEQNSVNELSKETFCLEGRKLASAAGLQVEPEKVWEAALGPAVSVTQDLFATHFHSWQCLADTHLEDFDGKLSSEIPAGALAQILSAPTQTGDRWRAHVNASGSEGWVTLAVGTTVLFQRSFAFLEDSENVLPSGEADAEESAEVAAADANIDAKLNLEVHDEKELAAELRKGTSKGKTRSRRSQLAPPPGTRKKAGSRVDAVVKDIVRLQASTCLLIPRASVARLVKDILQDLEPPAANPNSRVDDAAAAAPGPKFRMTPDALFTLQEVAENHVTAILARLNVIAHHRKAVTVSPKDMDLWNYLAS
eukprot:s35_g16.t1